MKNKKGFSLNELLVAIVIVGILSFVVGTTYRSYASQAKGAEAIKMISDLFAAEEVFYNQHDGYFYAVGGNITSDTTLKVDFSRNKYFTSFTLTGELEGDTGKRYHRITIKTSVHDGVSYEGTMDEEKGNEIKRYENGKEVAI